MVLEGVGVCVCACACVCVCVCVRGSPGNGGDARAVLVDEVPPGVQHPAVMQRHEGVPGRGGRVLTVLAVGVLQRRELVFPQHLEHHELPVRTQMQAGQMSPV